MLCIIRAWCSPTIYTVLRFCGTEVATNRCQGVEMINALKIMRSSGNGSVKYYIENEIHINCEYLHSVNMAVYDDGRFYFNAVYETECCRGRFSRRGDRPENRSRKFSGTLWNILEVSKDRNGSVRSSCSLPSLPFPFCNPNVSCT